MVGWIVYNGSLKVDKINRLVADLQLRAHKKNMKLRLVKNNDLMSYYDNKGELKIKTWDSSPLPDYAIFWDKDIILAKNLEQMGVRVFNSGRSIEFCDNKALMVRKLSNANIAMPKTILSAFTFQNQEFSDQYIQRVFDLLGDTVVLKESHGSFGMQVYKLSGVNELRNKIMEMKDKSFIIQEYIATSAGRDIRVNIVGDKIIGSMIRKNPLDFRANITLGGKGMCTEINEQQQRIAMQAHSILGLDFSGVDLLFGDDGQTLLCEVNSNVNYLSFEDITGVDFGNKLLDYIKESL